MSMLPKEVLRNMINDESLKQRRPFLYLFVDPRLNILSNIVICSRHIS